MRGSWILLLVLCPYPETYIVLGKNFSIRTYVNNNLKGSSNRLIQNLLYRVRCIDL